MTERKLPPADPSPPGRRVIVAVVTGEVGERIQDWRLKHDAEQARRIPPHTTLCYWAPEPSDELEHQMDHAFPAPVTVSLGGVHEFDNADHTFYVSVEDTGDLDAARRRLYDGTHLALSGRDSWTWHVTCVRYGNRRDLNEVRRLVKDLDLHQPWTIDTIALLELRGDRYERLLTWSINCADTSSR